MSARELSIQASLPTIEPASVTPMALMDRALDRGVDPDQLEKLMNLQDRWDAKQARQAFFGALAAFQSECPVICKTTRGDKATYAPLDHIVKIIQPLLHKHGLSVRFDTELTGETGAVMTATCFVSHISGHTETNRFACPVDAGPVSKEGRKVMNSAQSTASARSYCKRYALGDALNLVYADDVDDDGHLAGTQFITAEQAATIRDHIEALQIDEAKFLKYLNVATVDDIPAAKLKAVQAAIERKRKAKA
jgi:hypothetical protein